MRDVLEQLLRAAGLPNPERAEQLWAEYRAGGPTASAAFATLMAWYGGAIYRRVWGFLRSDAADDVFQDVLVKLHRARARLATFADALRWLRTVATAQCVDAHRRNRRRRAREAARAVPIDAAAPPGTDPELQDALRVGLAKLSEREREAVALVFFEEMTRQDAAAATGVHRDTFAALLDGALAKLRAVLGGVVVAGSVESALAAQPPQAPARIAGLARRAWETTLTGATSRLATAKVMAFVLTGAAVAASGYYLSRSPEMPAQPPVRARLGVESLEPRAVPSFGTNGVVTADIGLTQSETHRVAVQPDGKLVTAGGGKIARFNANGSLDTTFNGTGVVTATGFIWDMAVMPDGRIVVGGSVGVSDGMDFYLARFLSTGAPDTSFDGDGVVTTGFKKGAGAKDSVYGLALQTDGKIVAVGEINAQGQWGVARFHTDGSLDKTFSGDGWLTDEFDKQNRTEYATSVAIQTDGKIVVRGNAYRAATSRDVVVARYNSNGTLDASFGTGGKAWIDFGPEVGLTSTTERLTQTGGVNIDPTGAIVVATTFPVNGLYTVGIARLTSGGVLDTSFDGNGLLLAVPPGWRSPGEPSVTVQSDGKIVVTYTALKTDMSGGGTLMGRINADGTADTSFDDDGWRLYAFVPVNTSTPTDVLVQPDGKLVVVGYCWPAGTFLLGLARFNADGSLDAAP